MKIGEVNISWGGEGKGSDSQEKLSDNIRVNCMQFYQKLDQFIIADIQTQTLIEHLRQIVEKFVLETWRSKLKGCKF